MVMLAPHTLIELTNPAALTDNLPKWAVTSLKQAPYVIIRRGEQSDQIPVGIRGFNKNQRFATYLPFANCRRIITPQQALSYYSNLSLERKQLPAFAKLQRIAPLLSNYEWGISGSLQFELVTGLHVVNLASDIDIILSATCQLSLEEARLLLSRLKKILPTVHVDIQVVRGQNGFALEEFVQKRSPTVLMKTATGPKLVTDPWHFK